MNWKQFWGICEHKWKIISEREQTLEEFIGNSKRTIGVYYVLQCEKCGEMDSKYIGL